MPWTWLAVFLLAFCAEALGDVLSVYYQRSVRKLWRKSAMRWAGLLALLGWLDLSGVALGWPLSALVLGSVSGSMTGTWWGVSQQSIQARLRRKRKAEALDSPSPSPGGSDARA